MVGITGYGAPLWTSVGKEKVLVTDVGVGGRCIFRSGMYPCRVQNFSSETEHRSRLGVLGSRAQPVPAVEQASFWERLQEAWKVLIGAPSQDKIFKERFTRLLIRDRGFNSINLSRLYNAAKGAIKQHVELESDEDAEVTAVVERLGEIRLDFRVKRLKSNILDGVYSECLPLDLEPTFGISAQKSFWEGQPTEELSVHFGSLQASEEENMPLRLDPLTSTSDSPVTATDHANAVLVGKEDL